MATLQPKWKLAFCLSFLVQAALATVVPNQARSTDEAIVHTPHTISPPLTTSDSGSHSLQSGSPTQNHTTQATLDISAHTINISSSGHAPPAYQPTNFSTSKDNPPHDPEKSAHAISQTSNDTHANNTSSTPLIDGGLIKFNTPKSAQFYVPGKIIPFVHWDVGPSYAGLLPVEIEPPGSNSTRIDTTSSKDATIHASMVTDNSSPSNITTEKKIFFWFFPATAHEGTEKLTIWANGGPGCSSMVGALTENGPISWHNGQASPSKNIYSWTNASSILYIEHPLGYSNLTSNSVDELSKHIFGFLKNWLQVFPEMSPMKLYFTGEAYAGLTVPYIADYILSHKSEMPMKLRGVMLFNPVLTYDAVQMQVPVYPYVKAFSQNFRLNDTTMSHLSALHKDCGYEGYMNKYLSFPPATNTSYPVPNTSIFDVDGHKNSTCDLWEMVYQAAKRVNPSFNPYQITENSPVRSSVFGTPGTSHKWLGLKGDAIFFNRTDVKRLLHVPKVSNWSVCADPRDIIPQGNELPPSSSSAAVLGKVIGKTKRNVIVHGLLDFRIISNGTLIALQNMTWNGLQGFRTPIDSPFIMPDQGVIGRYHTERNLTYVELAGSGEAVAEIEPNASLQLFKYLVGSLLKPSSSIPKPSGAGEHPESSPSVIRYNVTSTFPKPNSPVDEALHSSSHAEPSSGSHDATASNASTSSVTSTNGSPPKPKLPADEVAHSSSLTESPNGSHGSPATAHPTSPPGESVNLSHADAAPVSHNTTADTVATVAHPSTSVDHTSLYGDTPSSTSATEALAHSPATSAPANAPPTGEAAHVPVQANVSSSHDKENNDATPEKKSNASLATGTHQVTASESGVQAVNVSGVSSESAHHSSSSKETAAAHSAEKKATEALPHSLTSTLPGTQADLDASDQGASSAATKGTTNGPHGDGATNPHVRI